MAKRITGPMAQHDVLPLEISSLYGLTNFHWLSSCLPRGQRPARARALLVPTIKTQPRHAPTRIPSPRCRRLRLSTVSANQIHTRSITANVAVDAARSDADQGGHAQGGSGLAEEQRRAAACTLDTGAISADSLPVVARTLSRATPDLSTTVCQPLLKRSHGLVARSMTKSTDP